MVVAFSDPKDLDFLGVPLRRAREIGDHIFDKVAESIENGDVDTYNEFVEKKLSKFIEGLAPREAFIAGYIFCEITYAIADSVEREEVERMITVTKDKILKHMVRRRSSEIPEIIDAEAGNTAILEEQGGRA